MNTAQKNSEEMQCSGIFNSVSMVRVNNTFSLMVNKDDLAPAMLLMYPFQSHEEPRGKDILVFDIYGERIISEVRSLDNLRYMPKTQEFFEINSYKFSRWHLISQ